MRNFFLYIILLVPITICSQQQKIDSLKSFLKHYKKEDTIRLNTLNILAYAYYSIDPEEGIKTSISAEFLAKNLKATTQLATAYSYRGHNYSALGSDSLALNMYDKAIAIYEEKSNKKRIARLIYNKGLVYFNHSDYKRANDCNREAYEVFEKEKDSFLMAKMLNSIGINHMSLTEYPEALSAYHKAILLYEKLNKKEDLEYASIHGNIGLLYARLKKPMLALEYQNKALKLFKKVDFQTGVANSLTSIGRIYNDLEKPNEAIRFYEEAYAIMKKNNNESGVSSALTNIGESYMILSNYKKALSYFLQTKEIYKRLDNPNNLASVHKNIGECYEKIKIPVGKSSSNLYRAEQSFEKSLQLAKQVGNLKLQYEVLERIADFNVKTNNYKKAYKVKNQAIVMKDSFNSITKREEIIRLEAQHEYNQEKVSLNAAYEKEKAITLAEVKRQKLLKKTIAIVGGIILISLLLSFLSYKKRKNALLAKEAAEFNTKVAETELKALRSQMNPHFIFNSLNSISDFIQKNKTRVANDYLIKFSKLTRAIFCLLYTSPSPRDRG